MKSVLIKEYFQNRKKMSIFVRYFQILVYLLTTILGLGIFYTVYLVDYWLFYPGENFVLVLKFWESFLGSFEVF